MSDTTIEAAAPDGIRDGRFDAVREAFDKNLKNWGEIGGAVAVYLDGKPVVDLWGGRVIRNGAPAEAWDADSLVCMMSINKGVTVLYAHRRDLCRPGRCLTEGRAQGLRPGLSKAADLR
jgi:CubicO group peptidase (beta-lactamase class C family)